MANQLSIQGSEAVSKFVLDQKKEFNEIKEEIENLRKQDKVELDAVKWRADQIINQANHMMKDMKEWVKGKKELQAAFVVAVKEKCKKLSFKMYKGMPKSKSKRKIYPSWQAFISAMMEDVIPLARSLNVLPLYCSPCQLICFRRRETFDPKKMIDLSKIFRSQLEDDHDNLKLAFAKALFKKEGIEDEEEVKDAEKEKADLLGQFQTLSMPQIALPGDEFSTVKHHQCLKEAEEEHKKLKALKDKGTGKEKPLKKGVHLKKTISEEDKLPAGSGGVITRSGRGNQVIISVISVKHRKKGIEEEPIEHPDESKSNHSVSRRNL